jgi:hypothetical protein
MPLLGVSPTTIAVAYLGGVVACWSYTISYTLVYVTDPHREASTKTLQMTVFYAATSLLWPIAPLIFPVLFASGLGRFTDPER